MTRRQSTQFNSMTRWTLTRRWRNSMLPLKFNGSAWDDSATDSALWISRYWGLVQGSEVGGFLLTPFLWPAIQVAGLIESPCAIPSKGACEAGGGVGLAGVDVGVVELFLSDIDAPTDTLAMTWNKIQWLDEFQLASRISMLRWTWWNWIRNWNQQSLYLTSRQRLDLMNSVDLTDLAKFEQYLGEIQHLNEIISMIRWLQWLDDDSGTWLRCWTSVARWTSMTWWTFFPMDSMAWYHTGTWVQCLDGNRDGFSFPVPHEPQKSNLDGLDSKDFSNSDSMTRWDELDASPYSRTGLGLDWWTGLVGTLL